MAKRSLSRYSRKAVCFVAGTLLCTLWGCSSNSNSTATAEPEQSATEEDPYAAEEVVELENIDLSGHVEKGPFIKGSSLKLFEMNGAKLAQTGKSYTGQIKKEDGDFSITASQLQSQYATLEVMGYYKNEVSGYNSNGTLTLTALVNLKDRREVNVNLLTHLEYSRVMSLYLDGMKFSAAKQKAAEEIYSTFGFDGDIASPDSLSIFGGNEGDAALLAVSVLMQGDRKEADMSELLAEVGDEIGKTGAWNDMERKTAIADWAFGTDLSLIRKNVEAWKKGKAPNFEKYVKMFWMYVYGLEKCTSKNKGSIWVIKNKHSRNYGQVLVCKNDHWQEASAEDVANSGEVISQVPTETPDIGNLSGTVTDSRDGKIYKTVSIGDQVWMAENLNYETSESRCAGSDCDTYGRLYPWESTQTDICPENWRVPTNEEWEQLYAYVDANNGDETIETSLKSQQSWVTPGSDRFGFGALSAGYYWNSYRDVGFDAAWWSSSEDNHNQGYDWRLYHGANYDDLGMPKEVGFAIRCIKQGASSSETTQPTTPKDKYDCGKYNCFTTEYLNQEMLAAGKYGELLDTRDNQVYRTTKICNQVWMAQNLNYLPASGTTYCYDDISSNCDRYGRLYVRAAVSCPSGWHLPDDNEWGELFECVGGQSKAADALRASNGWDKHPELNSADKFGFSSLPAGVYYFGDEGNTGWYLSDTGYNDFSVGTGSGSTKSTAADYTAISVRCVMD